MKEQRSFDEKKELWAKCLTFANYEVSTNGRVRRSTQSKSMPGQMMQRHLNKQDRLWVMLRNEYSQQVRVDVAGLVAEAFLGHVPGKTSIIFVASTKDPSASNIRAWLVDDSAPIHETAAGLEQRALFEQAMIDGSDPQCLKDIMEGA